MVYYMKFKSGSWLSHRDPIVFRRRIAPVLALSNLVTHNKQYQKDNFMVLI